MLSPTWYIDSQATSMVGPSSPLVRQDGRQFIPGKFDALDRQAVAPLLFPGSQASPANAL
ncbi:hypothetical protein [Rhodococcus marinonascens]|uniref:hypothetical protein n=1 Tax=Rhodococcus marinonascens TaxID=38311 RepID=UPI000AED9E71|nr:hypothetical protein [Rhodococcus marinonascens]